MCLYTKHRFRKMGVITTSEMASFSALILGKTAILLFYRRGREVLEPSTGLQITSVCLIVQSYRGMRGLMFRIRLSRRGGVKCRVYAAPVDLFNLNGK